VEIFGPVAAGAVVGVVAAGAVVGVVVAGVLAVLLVAGGLAAVDDLWLELPHAASASTDSGTVNSVSDVFIRNLLGG
jgi:hypothetical protein